MQVHTRWIAEGFFRCHVVPQITAAGYREAGRGILTTLASACSDFGGRGGGIPDLEVLVISYLSRKHRLLVTAKTRYSESHS